MAVWELPSFSTGRTITLAELRAAVRTRGDYENSDVFSDLLLTEWINDALSEVYDLLVQTWEDYYTTEGTLTTVLGSDVVQLPISFYKLVGLDWLNGTEYERLRSHRIDQRNASGTTTGEPESYRIQGRALRIQPIPAGAYSLRILFVPWAPRLVVDDDSWDGINGYEALVIEKALLLCDAREERPLGDRLARIERLEARVRTAANGRDASEPYFIEGGEP